MKTILLFTVLPLLIPFLSSASLETKKLNVPKTIDRCTKWNSISQYKHLYIKLCEYDAGGSGYYQFKNNYKKAVRFSFRIHHQNGNMTTGSTNVKPGEIHKASCYDCANKNGGGNKLYEINDLYFEGEEGFW